MSVNQDTLRPRMASGARRLFPPSFGGAWEQLRSGWGSVRKIGIGFGALAASNVFSFGVFPQLSTRGMAETRQALAIDMGRSLGEPVELETAPDFLTFHQRTLSGDGQAFIQKGDFGGVRPLEKHEMRQPEGNVRKLKQRLQDQALAGNKAQ